MGETATKTIIAEQAAAMGAPADSCAQASGWSAAASVGAALGVMGVASLSRARTGTRVEAASDMSSRSVAIPVGKAGFVGATNDSITVITRCPKTGRAREQQVRAATAMAAGSSTKAAINVGSMGAKTAAHLLKY